MRVALLFCLLPAIAACSAEPHALVWGCAFDDDTLRGRGAYVEAQILEGGCSGTVIYTTDISVATGGSARMPPELGVGRYGLACVARDGSCVQYARGCREVDLPDDAEVVTAVTVTAFAESALCPLASCTAGLCPVPDAGRMDGGGDDAGPDSGPGDDAGPFDAGPRVDVGPGVDAGFDAGFDAGPCPGGCSTGALCFAGSCVCAGSLFDDGEWCSDPDTDPRECGMASLCADAELCSGGACLCRPTLTEVGVECVDLNSDPRNCGVMGNTCPLLAFCLQGDCESDCGPSSLGLTACSRACVNLRTSPLHCGLCSNVCHEDEVCVDGDCFEYRTAANFTTGAPCTSCPCPGCVGVFDMCCPYAAQVLCLNHDAPECP